MDQSITQASVKSSTRGRAGLIVFGLIFTAMGMFALAALMGQVLTGIVRSRNWVARPCVIVASQVEGHSGVEGHSDSKGGTYRVKASYRYEWNDREYVGDRYSWSTAQGKGTQDVTIAQTQRVDSPAMVGRHTFEFVMPDGPYTMHGKLISVLWALELVGDGIKESARTPLVLSPYGEPVVLGEPPADNTPRPTL